MRTLGLPIDISPTEALLEEVRWTAGHVHWLRGKVQELEPEPTHTAESLTGDDLGFGSPSGRSNLVWGTTAVTRKGSGQFPGVDTTQSSGPSVWYELYARERQHLVAVCAATIKAGVEERRVRLAWQQGELVALAIGRTLDALQLTPAQLELVPVVVPRELRAITP